MQKTAIVAAILAASTGLAMPALAQSPFAATFGAAGNSGCYTRAYDAAHLKAHPRQRVTSIAIAYRPVMQSKQRSTAAKFEVAVGLRVKGDRELYARVGYCQPSSGGFTCSLESDGGHITLTLDGSRGLRLTTTSIRIEGNKRFIEVGGAASDDSNFAMTQAPSSACATLRRSVD